jgi:hypothetical protein
MVHPSILLLQAAKESRVVTVRASGYSATGPRIFVNDQSASEAGRNDDLSRASEAGGKGGHSR